MSFNVTGLDEIVRKLNKLPENVGKKLVKEAMAPAIEVMKEEVLRNTPVDKGGIRDSVTVKAGKGSKDYIVMYVRVGGTTESWYATLVEYGSIRHAPNPFVRRSYEAKKEECQNMIENDLRRLIDGEVEK